MRSLTRRAWLLTPLLVLGLCATCPAAAGTASVMVGSKPFTEGVILGEVVRALIAESGQPVMHQAGLGGTRILWGALLAGEIDVYPEYSGTLTREVLTGQQVETTARLGEVLAGLGLRMSAPLGFRNTYAIAVPEGLGGRLRLRRVSDLRDQPQLRFGFSNEFMDREDGWPGLRERYRLAQQDVRGLDHDLAYRGLAAGQIDATDVYTTDAEIVHYGLRVLTDDLGWFPDYQAILLYRADLEQRAPKVVERLRRLEGTIDEPTMAALNARVKLQGETEQQAAAGFLRERLGLAARAQPTGLWQSLRDRTLEHLGLVTVSLTAAILVAVPLGIAAARWSRLGALVLGLVGILQTIPSLALLVFLIPVLGIGWPPAVVALFLYSLLPIVRNTHAGLLGIPLPLRESAEVLGLNRGAQLRLVELPLAATSILAGIKTAAVINVGTATLAALIGAGGYGQPILTGIRLDDTALIMQGAIPAALLALLMQALFNWAERGMVPRGLRPRSAAAAPPAG
ncbi:glycine betaine ABC transporter substrate-binding protein [uncultured Thiodictyon sp.]|uniref:ABC transporter permease/substrate-binding protein n=1 Tax=uncultured Thiodictyon sp. TaxID=1846217 RepID=UPI0025EF94AD|nr:glycine betaine ABC transporter substrate-binding protein [uncultured Thiodictyon sp.]